MTYTIRIPNIKLKLRDKRRLKRLLLRVGLPSALVLIVLWSVGVTPFEALLAVLSWAGVMGFGVGSFLLLWSGSRLMDRKPQTLPVQSVREPKPVVEPKPSNLQTILDAHKIKGRVVGEEENDFLHRYLVHLDMGTDPNVLTKREGVLKFRLKDDRLSVFPDNDRGLMVIQSVKRSRPVIQFEDMLQYETDARIPFVLGLDQTTGQPVIPDMSEMPHVLVGGETGSGKSSAMIAIVEGIRHHRPEVGFRIVDPKKLDFARYEDDLPVVYDVDEAFIVLSNVVRLMDARYDTLHNERLTNVVDYNGTMPLLVVIIDEFCSLVKRKRGVVEPLSRILAEGRAAGIFCMLGTQRPDATVVEGLLKVNMPARLGLRVSDDTNGKIIMGETKTGIDKLLGNGDMLLSWRDQITRIQGAYCGSVTYR